MFDLGPRSNGEYLPVRAVTGRARGGPAAARPRGRDRAAPRPQPAAIPPDAVWRGDDARRAGRMRQRGVRQSRARNRAGRSTSRPPRPPIPTPRPRSSRGDEFVFDVQTHLLDFDLSRRSRARTFGSGFPYAECGEDDWRDCFGVDHWLEELFVRSDTTMAVVSAVPILAARESALDRGDGSGAAKRPQRVCGGDGRVFLHGQVNPNVGDARGRVRRHAPARGRASDRGRGRCTRTCRDDRGWFLDDHDPDGVQCGQAFLDVVREVGPKIVCVHKGLGDNSPWSSPVDIGAGGRGEPRHPVRRVPLRLRRRAKVRTPRRPPDTGINRLLASLETAGIGPDANVYAELGTTWWNAMRDPTQAAHVARQAAARFGASACCWGTDSIWYGTPQDQIQAFRTFQISRAVPGAVRVSRAHRRD